jgi:hypothetical protein
MPLCIPGAETLLNLGFLELHMLLCNGVIFLERQLFCLGTGVFLGDIEKARVSGAEQLNFEGNGLGHGQFSGGASANGLMLMMAWV